MRLQRGPGPSDDDGSSVPRQPAQAMRGLVGHGTAQLLISTRVFRALTAAPEVRVPWTRKTAAVIRYHVALVFVLARVGRISQVILVDLPMMTNDTQRDGGDDDDDDANDGGNDDDDDDE